jgi:hypothetical protein
MRTGAATAAGRFLVIMLVIMVAIMIVRRGRGQCSREIVGDGGRRIGFRR